jgi:branched-subunit amino acid aminotransferase/4-amino-4-deoxychorismate lyase
VQGALPAPVLPGITRQAVIELAQQRDLPVERRMLSVEDLLDADEVFLTNSGWQLLPVSSVERKTIGEGKAGPISRQLRHDLLELIERECGPNDEHDEE